MNIARLIHPGFWFGKTPLEQALTLAKRGVGGFCLYGGTRAEVAAFTTAVREASPLDHLLISADYEDGLGRWLPDAPLLPSNMALGAANDDELAFEKGLLTARQARSLGVDWVFAPVLDLANNPLNPIVNTRSFGADPACVIRLGRAFLKGLKQGGALNSIKHFPGHGDTSTDSHLALPVLHQTEKQLLARELIPFQALLPLADSVMLGHLLLPEIDDKNPASLSSTVADQLLRQQLHYNGCVLTDALLMKAIGDEKEAAWKALQAGVDILLVPQEPEKLISFLEEKQVSPEILDRSFARQEKLCAFAKQTPRPEQQEAFNVGDYAYRTARQALCAYPSVTPLTRTQTIHYLEIGNQSAQSAEPFLNTLRAHRISLQKYQGNAQHLLVLCFRRYQAFQGKIMLEKEEISQLQQALQKAEHSTCVFFASPWAIPATLPIEQKLFTFSPSPDFQRAAAEVLLGLYPPQGHLPISL
ncbi:MAG: hypothetical protein IKP06_00470 [Elusimicrobiaceae bacterium]|nr:hypothetical protein [Elusimicrobiaceae bacterium]